MIPMRVRMSPDADIRLLYLKGIIVEGILWILYQLDRLLLKAFRPSFYECVVHNLILLIVLVGFVIGTFFVFPRKGLGWLLIVVHGSIWIGYIFLALLHMN